MHSSPTAFFSEFRLGNPCTLGTFNRFWKAAESGISPVAAQQNEAFNASLKRV
jgi:hypothetical protein